MQTPRLTFEPVKHVYQLDGKRATSVTTILSGGIPKGALVPWAAKTAAQYAIDNPGATLDEIKGAPERDRDEAARRGTLVHDTIEMILRGEDPEIPEEIAAHIAGWRAFVAAWQITAVYQECIVGNGGLRYAGKFDLVGTSPLINGGKRLILDWKTSRSVHDEAALQMSAYAMAEFMIDPETGEEIPVPHVSASFVAHVTSEGTELYPCAENRLELRRHFRLFRDALDVYRGATPRRHALKKPLTTPAILAA